MRIAISGSHGVGKTTLAKKLLEITNYHFITETARKVAKEMGFKTNEEIRLASIETLKEFQGRIFYDQLLYEDGFPDFEQGLTGFISDRSIFDVIAYMQLYNLGDNFIKPFIRKAADYSPSYDLIIFCPIPAGAIASDGFRLTDSESQNAIDYHIRNLLNTQAKCDVIFLSKNRDAWIDTVKCFLKVPA